MIEFGVFVSTTRPDSITAVNFKPVSADSTVEKLYSETSRSQAQGAVPTATLRYAPGGMVFHVFHQGVARRTLFDKD